MSKTIYKYSLTGLKTLIELPDSFIVLHVGVQQRVVHIWVELDPEAPTTLNQFRIVPTGCVVNDDELHVGTVLVDNFVWHVYWLWEEEEESGRL